MYNLSETCVFHSSEYKDNFNLVVYKIEMEDA